MNYRENDRAYIEKVKRIRDEDPARLISELHEAHYLLESDAISQEAYDIVHEICMSYHRTK